MKVLFVFILPSGGVDTLNRLRYKALLPVGIFSHFLYFQRGSGSSSLPPEVPVFYASDPLAIQHILNFYSFDVIVVTSFFIQVPLFRQLGFTKPILFEIQGFGLQENARHNLIEAQPYLNDNVNAIIYPKTPHIGALLQELYTHKPKFAFSNPFDPDSFVSPLPAPLSSYPPLAWIGRLEDNKNWRDFLRIGAEVIKLIPSVRLWMFSDPELALPGETEELFQWSIGLGLTTRITHFYNVPHDQMPSHYEQIALSGGVLCMTSKAEGAPYVALEALNCGCPIVTSDSDGVKSAIIDEVTGLYYDHGDIVGAAEQIVRLMTTEKLRRNLVNAGKKHVRSDFSMEKYAYQFSDMLIAVGVHPC
ncbi:glycosyltransferase family 4 protein [Cohnella abietis]|uniref:Glycosyl transferase family 1 domain-containing protein n=1 Tax=Cohnella abietis TaxID=2507935 RepID=A0A3T1DAA3_9BACL|nr:glycosyltransferase family 4 protein [Cohnella abietis]BBI35003.1 hypothetical protein KCTCHS21_44020 [Cohnella abietis]